MTIWQNRARSVETARRRRDAARSAAHDAIDRGQYQQATLYQVEAQRFAGVARRLAWVPLRILR